MSTAPSSITAEHFYTKLGFEAVGESHHGDERTIIMERDWSAKLVSGSLPRGMRRWNVGWSWSRRRRLKKAHLRGLPHQLPTLLRAVRRLGVTFTAHWPTPQHTLPCLEPCALNPDDTLRVRSPARPRRRSPSPSALAVRAPALTSCVGMCRPCTRRP